MACAKRLHMDEALAVLLPALAMGLGWGIRGQFGHETGAMVPGALVGLALAVVSQRELGTGAALRLGAVGALACSLGGVMTYGQTLGLVHNRPGTPTRWWGLLGCAVKGSVWIGLTGAFLGMVGGGQVYRPGEVGLLCLGLTAVAAVGLRVLNRPHEPGRRLPDIYFSKRDDERPRPEYWGALWLALAALLLYLMCRGDRFAVAMGCWGILGGTVGFAGGEWLQAWGSHRAPFGARAQGWMDWWKVMEVSFGLVAGAALGLGWLLLEPSAGRAALPYVDLALWLQVIPLVAWVAWLVVAETGVPWANGLWEVSFAAMVIPMAFAFGGGLWPAVLLLPVLLLVGGDDVVRQWCHRERLVKPPGPWLALAVLVAVACVPAWRMAEASASAWLVAVAWVQTGLTVLWAAGRRAVLARGAHRPRLPALGSALTVEVIFVALAVALHLLAWCAARA